jgi:hypothetical protein
LFLHIFLKFGWYKNIKTYTKYWEVNYIGSNYRFTSLSLRYCTVYLSHCEIHLWSWSARNSWTDVIQLNAVVKKKFIVFFIGNVIYFLYIRGTVFDSRPRDSMRYLLYIKQGVCRSTLFFTETFNSCNKKFYTDSMVNY